MLDMQIRRLDLNLQPRLGDDARVEGLLTIPGMGTFIAIALVLELGDLQRYLPKRGKTWGPSGTSALSLARRKSSCRLTRCLGTCALASRATIPD